LTGAEGVLVSRYAEALFGAADKAGELDPVASDLQSLKEGFESSGLKRFLRDPQFRADDKKMNGI